MSLIQIVDGAAPYSDLDISDIERASLYAIRHPKRRHLFSLTKARFTPDGKPIPKRLVTVKTLYRYISVNL
jgi:hypothetical protein